MVKLFIIKFFYFFFIISILLGEPLMNNTYYQYNNNGRVIIPEEGFINNLSRQNIPQFSPDKCASLPRFNVLEFYNFHSFVLVHDYCTVFNISCRGHFYYSSKIFEHEIYSESSSAQTKCMNQFIIILTFV